MAQHGLAPRKTIKRADFVWRTVLVVLVPTHNQHGEALNALKWPTLAPQPKDGRRRCLGSRFQLRALARIRSIRTERAVPQFPGFPVVGRPPNRELRICIIGSLVSFLIHQAMLAIVGLAGL